MQIQASLIDDPRVCKVWMLVAKSIVFVKIVIFKNHIQEPVMKRHMHLASKIILIWRFKVVQIYEVHDLTYFAVFNRIWHEHEWNSQALIVYIDFNPTTMKSQTHSPIYDLRAALVFSEDMGPHWYPPRIRGSKFDML